MTFLAELEIPQEDLRLIQACLDAAMSGPFFPEWEFETLFGIERNRLATIFEQFPNIDIKDPDTVVGLINTLNNLLGYPHGRDDAWARQIPYSRDEVQNVFDRLRITLSEFSINRAAMDVERKTSERVEHRIKRKLR